MYCGDKILDSVICSRESQRITVAAGRRMKPIFQHQVSTLLTAYLTMPEYVKRV